MKKYVIFIVLLGLSLKAANGYDELAAVEKVFRSENIDATFVVVSADGELHKVFNQERSLIRFSPASTFKVLNTLIALKFELVGLDHSAFQWDGNQRGVSSWNKNHSLSSAFKVSCVWCYQKIAREVGVSRYAMELRAASYGNQAVHAPVDLFWLNGDLTISANEQIDFLKRLVNNTLPYRRSHLKTLKEIMLVEQTPNYSLYAKSGWTGAGLATGWYVGYIETSRDTFVFAMNMLMHDAEQAPLRKKLVIESLRALKLI
ncbi:MAG: beta-lactamase class D [Arenicella sp.]|jgi:beta-lactamase class D